MSDASPCRFCPVTRFICFWGEINPYAPWRRSVLLVCSLLLTALYAGVMWFYGGEMNLFLWLISVPMLLVSLLGIAASLAACERCVVRLYGDV